MSPTSNLMHSSFFRSASRFLVLYCSILALLLLSSPTEAQNYTIGKAEEIGDLELVNRGETLKGFRLHRYLGTPYQSAPDTAVFNFYRTSSIEGKGLAVGNNGNGIGPRQYKTFFDRLPEWDPFIYITALDGLVYRPERILFYDTKSPYSKAYYRRFGAAEQREEELDMTLALNVNKNINLGSDFNYTLSRGYYISSQAREVSYRLFGAIRLPRYELFLSGGNNYFQITENGGLANDAYITNPEQFSGGRRQIKSIEIPVRFASGVGNSLYLGHIFLTHRYNFGQNRHFMLGDRLPNGTRTAADTTLFVPIAAIGHKMEYKHQTRLFIGKNGELAKTYGKEYPYYWKRRDGLSDTVQVLPFDSTRLTQINNTVFLSVREGFRPWVKFGLTAYARLENNFYFMRDSLPGNGKSRDFSTYVGGNISRTTGKGLNFDINGEVALLGYGAGNMRLDGNISTLFKLWEFPLSLKAEAHFYNLKPPVLLQHHRGTFLRWDKDFGFMQSLQLGGTISLPRYGTELSIRSATLGNYIYFGADRLPYAYEKPLQVLEARIRHGYNWRMLGWEAETSYQLSSNKEVLPLPMLSAYASLYLKFYVAKVMYTQLGADCYYHTNYRAPYYDPASQQFINQKDTMVGNYPFLNAFANFKLRRVRFYLVYYNLGDLFITPPKRFSLAHYPVNPSGLRIGISFDFNN